MKNNTSLEQKRHDLIMLLKGATIFAVIMFIALVGTIINVDATTVKTVTVNLNNKKSATVNLKKALKKGDKITKKSVKKACSIYKVKYVSSKKIKVSVDPNSFTGNDTFKIKTKKKRTIKVKVICKDRDNGDYDDNIDDTAVTRPTYAYEANGHKFTFKSEDEKKAFISIVTELKSQFNDPDTAYKEIYGRQFKATVPDNYKKYRLFQFYFTGTIKIIYANIDGFEPGEAIAPAYPISHECYLANAKGVPPRMWYPSGAKFGTANETYRALYNGVYTGVCGESAYRIVELAKALGFNAVYCANDNHCHAWACIEMIDSTGTRYWQGIDGSSSSCSLTFDSKTYLKEGEKGMHDYKPVWNFGK